MLVEVGFAGERLDRIGCRFEDECPGLQVGAQRLALRGNFQREIPRTGTLAKPDAPLLHRRQPPPL